MSSDSDSEDTASSRTTKWRQRKRKGEGGRKKFRFDPSLQNIALHNDPAQVSFYLSHDYWHWVYLFQRLIYFIIFLIVSFSFKNIVDIDDGQGQFAADPVDAADLEVNTEKYISSW